MYTAEMARQNDHDNLDLRIEAAVKDSRHEANSASLRVYLEDPFVHTIKEELTKRGFKNIVVPDITLKGDVHFEW